MMNEHEKYYPPIGDLSGIKNYITSFDESSPWKDADVSFNWLKFEFPKKHGHSDWEILIVLNGEIVHHINNSIEYLSAGNACIIGPKDKHFFVLKNKKTRDFQGLSLLVRDKYMKNFALMYSSDLYNKLLTDINPKNFFLSNNSLEKCTNMLLDINFFSDNNHETDKETCTLVLHHILLKFLEQTIYFNKVPKELKLLIKTLTNPEHDKADIKNVIKALPYSYSQITRIFKKHFGCSITQYANQIKMNYAKELLSNKNMPLKQIADNINIGNISYFHHLFKKNFGITPTEYKNNIPNH